jgi:hypothetical protein
MLVARVITNSSNVATITNLSNKSRQDVSQRVTGTPTDTGSGSRSVTGALTLNWARTPTLRMITGNVRSLSPSPAGALDGYAAWVEGVTVTRYAAQATAITDWTSGAVLSGLEGYIDFAMGA